MDAGIAVRTAIRFLICQALAGWLAKVGIDAESLVEPAAALVIAGYGIWEVVHGRKRNREIQAAKNATAA